MFDPRTSMEESSAPKVQGHVRVRFNLGSDQGLAAAYRARPTICLCDKKRIIASRSTYRIKSNPSTIHVREKEKKRSLRFSRHLPTPYRFTSNTKIFFIQIDFNLYIYTNSPNNEENFLFHYR